MIEGVLRHCTDMEIEKNYVDTRGQSEVGFAFCHLLGFKLLPRLKGIGRQRLYRPEKGNRKAYPNLQLILTRPINWKLIKQYYDEMIKYATFAIKDKIISAIPIFDDIESLIDFTTKFLRSEIMAQKNSLDDFAEFS